MAGGDGFWVEGPAEWQKVWLAVQGSQAASRGAGSPRSPWLPECPVGIPTTPASQPEGPWSPLFQKLHLSEDVAGATFMAAGSSTPELFASVIGKKSHLPKTRDLRRAQGWRPARWGMRPPWAPIFSSVNDSYGVGC